MKVLEIKKQTVKPKREVTTKLYWQGSPYDIVFEPAQIQEKLNRTDLPCYVMKDFKGRIGVANG